MTKPVYTVSPVPNKRKPGQRMVTFYMPEAEFDAFKAAYTAADDTATNILRKAATNYVKRADRAAGRPERAVATQTPQGLQRFVAKENPGSVVDGRNLCLGGELFS